MHRESLGDRPNRPPPEDGEGEVYFPTADQLERSRWVSEILEDAPAEDILHGAADAFYLSLTMATAFGPEGCVILSMLARLQPKVRVFNLDTGYQFPETLELRNCIAEKYGSEVLLARPEPSVEEREKRNGGPLSKSNPERCCFERKVQVVRREVEGYRAWISGIRRDQSPDWANAPIVGWDKKFGLVKINLLARWTQNQVWQKIIDEDIPYNPLHVRGYPSSGCWPCTRPVPAGEDERAGRWSGTEKTECGLHPAEDQPTPPPTMYGQI